MSEPSAQDTSFFSIWLNVFLAIIKGITGVLGNSSALIADAIESTTDVFSSIIVWFGIKYASLPADENHPYGHGKAEPLVAFVIVVFLVVAALGIAYTAIQDIANPTGEVPEAFTLWVLIGIILVKEFSFKFVKKRSIETGSTALLADAWHHRSDAITSVVAFMGIAITLYAGEGFQAADDWAALFSAVIIVFNAAIIFRPAMSELMDEHLYEDKISYIREIAMRVPGVCDTEKCFIRKTGIAFHVDLHLVVDGNISVRAGHDIAHALKRSVKKELPEVMDILIHVEPDNSDMC